MRILLRIIIVFLAIGIALLLIVNNRIARNNPLPFLGQIPPFELTERDGSPFNRDHLYGKIGIVDFIFTHCEGPCPLMSTKMAQLYRQFKGNNLIQFISVSVDPERDTLERLRDYAGQYGVRDNRWLFLRGPIETITNLSLKGFMLPTDGLPVLHSTRFVLVDDKAEIRGYYDSTDPSSVKRLKTHIEMLVNSTK